MLSRMPSRQRGNFSEAPADSAFHPGPGRAGSHCMIVWSGRAGPPGVVAQGGGDAVAPASRRMVMTSLRRLAMMRGPLAVRCWKLSSSKSRSRTQCRRSSMPQLPRMKAASWVAGLGEGQRGDYGGGDRGPGLAERQRIHRQALGCAVRAAVAAFPLAMSHRNLAPGQGGKLGVQAGLVAPTPSRLCAPRPAR